MRSADDWLLAMNQYFFFFSFLLLGLTTRAPRQTPGFLALFPFRPEDKILSS